jgi:hypothetical protein
VSKVRPLEPADLPPVVDLYARVMRTGLPPASSELVRYFERTFLRQPWADPEMPSLVHESDEGRILGFLGSHVRRLGLGDRSIRAGYVGQLVSDPAARRRGAGTVLLRHYMAGPQELTITDGASPDVARIWKPLGGRTVHSRSIVWTRLLRPARALGDRLLARRGAARLESLSRPLRQALDAAGKRLARPGPASEEDAAEELTVERLLEHLPERGGEPRLQVAYDEGFLRWLLEEMAAVQARGPLVAKLIHSRGGVAGWYVAYIPRGDIAEVLAVTTTRRGAEPVLDHLLATAWQGGASAVQGRLEPDLFEPLSERRCVLRHGERVLFHAADPDVARAVELSRLTRMDGEWWMGHHLDPLPA